MIITTPLFWCLKVDQQAALLAFYWDLCGHKLDIPPMPNVSKAAWQAAWEEVDPELERLMKLPAHSHKLEER